MAQPPASLDLANTAFFFDFDGTLVELASTPDQVVVEPRAFALIDKLRSLTAGAVAIVSGRAIDNLDTMLAPLRLPTAGLHGAERRDANNDTLRVGFGDERLITMERMLEQVVADHPGMLLEIKGAALALHYRNAPTREAAARAATEQLAERFADAYVLQPGKMVFEIKPRNVDKGRAIAAFLDEPPFAGRTPVFAGDDLTDEKGFAIVNARRGVSIKVGAGETIGHHRVDSVTALLDWVEQIVLAAQA
ncbi:MAG TPA: trehalose-phosphatase [Pararobbsia sp.]|nr:trehalose-phosphatase [Pararobbsia sp.]